MSSFCLGCGNSMAEGERFCAICGRDSSEGLAAPRVDPAVAFGLPPETSGKAIVSLICGIIVLFFPFSICALAFGYLALSDIRKSPGRLTGRGVAIAGIVLGYLGIAFTLTMVGFGIYGLRMEERQRTTSKGELLRNISSDDSAVASLRTLNTAEIAYAQAHHAIGFTCSMSDLSGAWGLSSDLAHGKKNGYVFALRACIAEKPHGPIVKYKVVAFPDGTGKSGPAYCSDQSDVIRVARNGSASDCLNTGVDLSESEMNHP